MDCPPKRSSRKLPYFSLFSSPTRRARSCRWRSALRFSDTGESLSAFIVCVGCKWDHLYGGVQDHLTNLLKIYGVDVIKTEKQRMTNCVFNNLVWICTRVAELGSLSSGAKMAMKIYVKCVFTIFATNASFLRVIANLQKYAIYAM